jgi:hypothetical protein
MMREERAIQRRMSPEEKTEIRRAEKESWDEALSWKLAESALMNSMTFEERLAYYEESAEECRALGYNAG